MELGSLGMGGVADPKIHAPSPRVILLNLVVLGQTVRGLLRSFV